MYRKVVARSFGSADVLKVETVEGPPGPPPGEVRVRVEAAGVGYTDTIVRRGRYIGYKGGLPVTPGYDMAGTVDAVGSDVSNVVIGDRVADMTVTGAYSQYVVRSAAGLIPVPPGVRPEIAVEVPLMWMTAWQMLTRAVRLEPGTAILVVGARGNVGRALVALGHHLGLKVIGTGSSGSLDEIGALGATAIDYRRPDLVAAVRDASGGGVAAAFDAIGGKSWIDSHAALATRGILVGYGLQDFLDGGRPNRVAIQTLVRFKWWNIAGRLDGSGRRTRFYNIQDRRRAEPDEYREDASALFALIAAGRVQPPEPEILALDRAAEAHERIARGGLRKRLVLDPWRETGP